MRRPRPGEWVQDACWHHLVDDHGNDQDEAKKGAKALDHAKVTITNCSMQSTHVIVMRRMGIFGHGGIKDTHDK